MHSIPLRYNPLSLPVTSRTARAAFAQFSPSFTSTSFFFFLSGCFFAFGPRFGRKLDSGNLILCLLGTILISFCPLRLVPPLKGYATMRKMAATPRFSFVVILMALEAMKALRKSMKVLGERGI
jgi:hypothetical protein